jgi:hypothetical protein
MAESDRNRAELAHEIHTLKRTADDMVSPVRNTGRLITLGTKIIGTLLSLRRLWMQMGRRPDKEEGERKGNKNWAAALLRAARIGISLWPAFRSRAR